MDVNTPKSPTIETHCNRIVCGLTMKIEFYFHWIDSFCHSNCKIARCEQCDCITPETELYWCCWMHQWMECLNHPDQEFWLKLVEYCVDAMQTLSLWNVQNRVLNLTIDSIRSISLCMCRNFRQPKKKNESTSHAK